ncbi:LOW QUALITY PROTEIN: hypothetical protein HID58_085959, partial [Brassica napus]
GIPRDSFMVWLALKEKLSTCVRMRQGVSSKSVYFLESEMRRSPLFSLSLHLHNMDDPCGKASWLQGYSRLARHSFTAAAPNLSPYH